MGDAELVCHELLLRLAGRLPDKYLWRYRDWLAGGAADVIARALPRTLLHEGIALAHDEFRLLSQALLPFGADPDVVHAILPGVEPAAERYTFVAESPFHGAVDNESLVLGATLRGRQGVREVRSSWRLPTAGDQRHKRVLLVLASSDFITLTGEVQRIMRALGDHEPSVEVFTPQAERTAYHRAAMNQSVLVCAGAEQLAGHHVG